MKQENKTEKLQKWIMEHTADWYTICGMGSCPINDAEFLRLQDELMANGFYDITLVLLTCHMYAVQERIIKSLKVIAECCDNEFKRRGIDPEFKA